MIDWEARKKQEDEAVAADDKLTEFQRWTLYLKRYNEGFRIVDARRRIEELSPRTASGSGC